MIMGAVYLSYSAYFLSADFNGIKQFMRVIWFNNGVGINSFVVFWFGSEQCEEPEIVFDLVEDTDCWQQIEPEWSYASFSIFEIKNAQVSLFGLKNKGNFW